MEPDPADWAMMGGDNAGLTARGRFLNILLLCCYLDGIDVDDPHWNVFWHNHGGVLQVILTVFFWHGCHAPDVNKGVRNV